MTPTRTPMATDLVAHGLLARPFRHIENFNEWFERWTRVETFEEAAGLLHAIPDHVELRHDPRALRIMREIARTDAVSQRCQCSTCPCVHTEISRKVRKDFMVRILKEDGDDPSSPPVWWSPFEQDPTLLESVLDFLFRGWFRDEPFGKIARAFLRRWAASRGLWDGHDHNTRDLCEEHQRLLGVRTANLELIYRTCFRYGIDEAVANGAPESLDALRTLALEEHRGRRPRDLAEALIWREGRTDQYHASAARRLLFLELKQSAEKRAAAERDRAADEHELERIAGELAALERTRETLPLTYETERARLEAEAAELRARLAATPAS